MSRFVALLRGVNVGGNRKIAMADLRDFFAELGYRDAQTVLQSGNVVFAAAGTAGALEKQLEAEARARLGLATDFHVRSAVEWRAVVAANPFARAAKDDPAHLVVHALRSAPGAAQVRALRDAIAGRETVEVRGRHAYIVYPDGIGTSRLTAAVLDARLDARGTGRNWNTVLKLQALLDV
ncbi:MAG: DUF1697 domain-containing protein [Gemmatimonadota bacterium]|nr:DUF1697 domain-containing protein [Gemmatimonadota bacterium]